MMPLTCRPSERVQSKIRNYAHFRGRLCDKIGLLCDKLYHANFSGLINIVLPGLKGEKSLSRCLTDNLNVKE